jgi:hypothetical protein
MSEIAVGGKVIDVGKMECTPPDCNGNEVVLEVTKGQLIRISGMSDKVTRWLAGRLYLDVVLRFEADGGGGHG